MEETWQDQARRGVHSARIGERRAVAHTQATWWVPAATLVRPHKRRAVPVTVTDASVTGIGVTMGAADAPAVGAVVQMDLGEASGDVRVKVVRPGTELGSIVVGGELVGAANDLLDPVLELLGDDGFVPGDEWMQG